MWREFSAALAAICVAGLPSPSAGEVITDGSLGSARNLAGPNFAIGADLGRQVGGNLFHSFSRFNLATGETATFSGPGAVANVVGRVTGGTPSSIDGTLRSTIAGASLYLLNPAGILFKPNARIDVSGSFHASTADYLRFADGARFETRTTSGSSFTAAAPEAFGFLAPRPAAITLDRPLLGPPPGKSLSLVGGPIQVTGGPDTAIAVSDGGALNLVAVGAPGEVVLGPGAFKVGSIAQFADIIAVGPVFLAAQTGLNAAPDVGPGALAVRGANLTLDGAFIFAPSQGALTSASVDVRLTGDLDLRNGAAISAGQFAQGGAGTPGPITVSARGIRLTDSLIQSSSFGSAPAGSVTVNAGEAIEIVRTRADRLALISATAAGTGAAGDVSITAKSLELSNEAQVTAQGSLLGSDAGVITVRADRVVLLNGASINTSSFTAGGGGAIQITAPQVLLTGTGANFLRSFISAGSIAGQAGSVTVTADHLQLEGGQVETTTGDGRAGTIDIMVDRLTLADNGRVGARISSDVLTNIDGSPRAGSAGNITIVAREAIMMADGPLPSDVVFQGSPPLPSRISSDNGGTGQPGRISLSTGTLDMRTATLVSTQTVAPGNAGDIEINAGRVLLDDAAGIVAVSRSIDPAVAANASQVVGDAGNIAIKAGTVTMRRGGFVSNTTRATGRGGQVAIAAADTLDIAGAGPGDPDPSGVFSRSFGSQAGGRITLAGRDVAIRDGGIVTAESQGAGPAGSINVAADRLTLGGGAGISTEAASGGGGDIVIRAGELVHLSRSQITTSVRGGTGSGGNISIDPRFVVLNDGVIRANAFGGNGGNITITADQFFQTPGSVIEASSQRALNGTIQIRAPEADVTGGMTELSDKFFDAAAIRREGCTGPARAERQPSSLIATGRGGLPQDGEGAQPGHYFAGRAPDDTRVAAAAGSGARERVKPATLRIRCG